MTSEPLVLVVDDDASVRAAMKRLLQSEGLAARTFSCTTEVFAHGRPDGPCCLVLDVRLGGADGLSFHEQIVGAGIHVPTIFVTGYGDVPMSVRAMKSGAVDFLCKPFQPARLISCVKAALEEDRRSLAWEHRVAVVRQRYATLTPREQEILVDVAAGMPNKQIAYEYGISEKTVKVHRARVMEKMGAEALTDLVRMADLLGLPCARPDASDEDVGGALFNGARPAGARHDPPAAQNVGGPLP